MSGKYSRELKRIWKNYQKKDLSETEKEFKTFLEKSMAELKGKCFQTVGRALHKLAPIEDEEKDEKVRFFWKIADEWNIEIRKRLKDYRNAVR